MKRTLFIISMLLLSINVFPFNSEENNSAADPYNLEIKTQTATPTFSFDGGAMAGWYFPITIPSDVPYQGLGFTVEFSTGETPMNKSIIVIGTEYQFSIDYGLDFKENNNYITVSRHVKQGEKIGFYKTDSWDKNLLERNTNYVLNIEIDETRFRYSIKEKGSDGDAKYEYEFYGLANSYLRQRLKDDYLAVAVNVKNYAVQSLRVYDLGHGVGVEPSLPKTDIHYAHIVNKNSGLYLRRYGSPGFNDWLIQGRPSGSANDMWKIVPVRQNSRTPDNYNVVIKNMYRDLYINPQNCSSADNTFIYETSSTDCSTWKLKTSNEGFIVQNDKTQGNMYVYLDSKDPGQYVRLMKSSVPTSSVWSFEEINISSPLPSGYYTFKVAVSNRYMSVLSKSNQDGAYIVQASNDHSDAKVWYIDEQDDGTYSIRNLDTNKYLAVEGDSFASDAYLVQRSRFNGYASEKWIIEDLSGYYSLKNLASGKTVQIRYDSLSENEYFIQSSNTFGGTRLFTVEPVNFSAETPLGGMFLLQNTYTTNYLTVQNQSKEANAYLVATDNPNSKASWWTVEKTEGGAFVLKNVNSSMYVTVQNRSGSSGAYLIQTPLVQPQGELLWHFHHSDVPAHNIYFINNVFSGMTMNIENSSSTSGSYITQQVSNNEDLRMRWKLIPVSRTNNLNAEQLSFDSEMQKVANTLNISNEVKYNLANDILRVFSSEKKMKDVYLISIAGKILKHDNVNHTYHQINMSMFSSNIYLLQIKFDDNSIKTIKIKY